MLKPKLRQCISCRQLLDRQRLAKLTLLVSQPPTQEAWKLLLPFEGAAGYLPGRSSYICPTVACVKLALKKRAFSRTLRKPLPPEAQAYLEQWLSALQSESLATAALPTATPQKLETCA